MADQAFLIPGGASHRAIVPTIDNLSDVDTTTDAIQSGQVLEHNGTNLVPVPGSPRSFERKTANFSAEMGKAYLVDTAGGNVTMTLPSYANAADRGAVWVMKAGATNKLTIQPTGAEFVESAGSYAIERPGNGGRLVADSAGGSTIGWKLYPDHAEHAANKWESREGYGENSSAATNHYLMFGGPSMTVTDPKDIGASFVAPYDCVVDEVLLQVQDGGGIDLTVFLERLSGDPLVATAVANATVTLADNYATTTFGFAASYSKGQRVAARINSTALVKQFSASVRFRPAYF